MQMDALDKLAETALDGFLVRKDLVRTFARQYPVPTYVVEFLLGRYCASTNQSEIDEGLAIVERQLSSRTVRSGEQGSLRKIKVIASSPGGQKLLVHTRSSYFLPDRRPIVDRHGPSNRRRGP